MPISASAIHPFRPRRRISLQPRIRNPSRKNVISASSTTTIWEAVSLPSGGISWARKYVSDAHMTAASATSTTEKRSTILVGRRSVPGLVVVTAIDLTPGRRGDDPDVQPERRRPRGLLSSRLYGRPRNGLAPPPGHVVD